MSACAEIENAPGCAAIAAPHADADADATNGRRTDRRILDERVRRLANGPAGLSRKPTEYQ